MTKIYVTQKENDEFFNQKLPTFRNGFCYIDRKIVKSIDPLNVYDNYGTIKVNGLYLAVNIDTGEIIGSVTQ